MANKPTKYWSIIDGEDKVVGEWTGGGVHIVHCYPKAQDAKKDALFAANSRLQDYTL